MESNDSPEIPDRGGDIRHPRPPFRGVSVYSTTLSSLCGQRHLAGYVQFKHDFVQKKDIYNTSWEQSSTIIKLFNNVTHLILYPVWTTPVSRLHLIPY